MGIVDISTYQGAISAAGFALAKNFGVNRIIHKAGGSNVGQYTDSHYVGNAARVREAGLDLGHYWFNGHGDPAADANYFIDHLASYQAGDWLVLDVENEAATNTTHWGPSQVMAFATQVFNRTGVKVVVYMSSSVTYEDDWSGVVAFGCPLWVAQYSANPPTVQHWPGWAAWQRTDAETVPGIGSVDFSVEGNVIVSASTGKTIALNAPQEDEMKLVVFIADNQTDKGKPEYGSTGIMQPGKGWQRTSKGLGPRTTLDHRLAAASAIGLPVEVRHVSVGQFGLWSTF
jgi:GH25 family lysozyme M1 (1,4-beta-N-acetylmuramidase)